MALAQKDIEKKYSELFHTWFAPLCYFARKYIRDMDTCREIVHNVFVSIWEKKNEFDFEKPARSYLFTSVYNRCLNHIRDQKKYAVGKADTSALEMYDQAVNEDHLEAAELEAKIKEGIDSLPDKCREVFILNRFEEKKYAEIADKLNLSVKTVEAQMSKALRILRDHLTDYLHLLILVLLKNLW